MSKDAVGILELGWGGEDTDFCLGMKMNVLRSGACPRSGRAQHHPGHLRADCMHQEALAASLALPVRPCSCTQAGLDPMAQV